MTVNKEMLCNLFIAFDNNEAVQEIREYYPHAYYVALEQASAIKDDRDWIEHMTQECELLQMQLSA